MPSPNPPAGLQSLTFDHAAASAAIDACLRAAARLDDATRTRDRVAAVARDEWRGPARDEFDDDLGRVDLGAASLAEDLRAAAWSIGAAAESARIENVSRREARLLWQRSQLVG